MSDSIDNIADGGLAGIIRQGTTNYMKDVHTALPGKIVSFNSLNQTVSVQLLIRRVFKGDQEVDLPQLINVPVWTPRAGGFVQTFPIAPDDQCLILFAERSIDTWFTVGDVQTPNSNRMHSFSDAICLLGLYSEPTAISDYDTENFQIRNEEKDQTITLLNNKNINISTGTVTVEMLNSSETINITAPVKININTPLAEFATDVKISGNLNITGTSTAADHDSGGISGKNHTHIGSPTAPTGPIVPTGTPQ